MILNSRKNWFAIFWSKLWLQDAFARPLRFFVLSGCLQKPSLLHLWQATYRRQRCCSSHCSRPRHSLNQLWTVHCTVASPCTLSPNQLCLCFWGRSMGKACGFLTRFDCWALESSSRLKSSQCDNVLEIKPFWFGEHFRTERFWKNTNSVSEPLAEWIVDSYTTCVLDAVCDFTSNVASSNHLSVMNSHNAEVNMKLHMYIY